jgi:hypothetical protein
MLARKPTQVLLKSEDREELIEQQQKREANSKQSPLSGEHLLTPQPAADERKKRTAAQRIGIQS